MKRLVSNKIFSDEKNYKHFICHLYYNYKVKPTNKPTIWDKVSADIKNDTGPVYNKMFLKTKIKSYGDEVTDFYD